MGVCVYPLEHAAFNGLTPTDLVFPFFMFIMEYPLIFLCGNIILLILMLHYGRL